MELLRIFLGGTGAAALVTARPAASAPVKTTASSFFGSRKYPMAIPFCLILSKRISKKHRSPVVAAVLCHLYNSA